MEKSPNSSPEFEFWMSSNNNNNPPSSSFSHPENLLSADELFSDGVILPLNTHPPPPRAGPTTATTTTNNNPPPPPAPPTISSSPKRWKLMFRPSSREAKRTNGANSMELNIHIWPFSRSRSSGNTASRSSSSGRKSCSAPCSRSNSRGDSETAAAATSSAAKPATGTAAATAPKKRGQLVGGIYIGRSVPVWQLRPKNHGNNNNNNNNNNNGRGAKKVNVGINMLNLKNVNTCIGYGSNNVNGQVSGCRVEDKDEVAEGDGSGGDVIRGGSLLKFRAIFSKKVHV